LEEVRGRSEDNIKIGLKEKQDRQYTCKVNNMERSRNYRQHRNATERPVCIFDIRVCLAAI